MLMVIENEIVYTVKMTDEERQKLQVAIYNVLLNFVGECNHTSKQDRVILGAFNNLLLVR